MHNSLKYVYIIKKIDYNRTIIEKSKSSIYPSFPYKKKRREASEQ